MPEYLTPDVYVEEVPQGVRPIEAVGSRVAAFVGVAPAIDSHGVTDPIAVNNWLQFRREFVGDKPQASTPLSHAVFGFFQNGGNRCWVVNIGAKGSVQSGLDSLKAIDEIAIVAAPGYVDVGDYDVILEHCETLRDRVAILDAPEAVTDITLLTEVALAGDAGKPADAAEGGAARRGLRARASDDGFGAFYFPWIVVRDVLSEDPRATVPVAPSGHIAGIWARSDATRGVHKAPANEIVRGALNVTRQLDKQEQASLNPAGVNCIRFFPREGIRVWGARTLAGSASEWRYLNVRRLFVMIEESIAEATRWIVFEPNDPELWKSIRRDIGAFLSRVWRDGALMGRTANEAFFVKCDEETNPQEDIDAGRVTAIIGLAPVKPAEFVIFRISQHAAGVEIQTAGGNRG
jgi:Bacteriophage tail sheath protein